jgi:putative sugar O-methyltransferase
MTAEVEASSPLFRPSRFWDPLNALNLQWLDEFGLENFKRTLAQNYFNWMVVSPFDVQFRTAFREWLRDGDIRDLSARMEGRGLLRSIQGGHKFGPYQRLVYRTFVTLCWHTAGRDDRLGLRARLEEPALGNPFAIRKEGRLISQDLANSIRECNVVDRFCAPLTAGAPRVAELGAGYGRLAWVFLAGTSARYFIVDIPPALYVSQWYLTRLLPDRKIFRFRHFERFDDVRAELEAADVAFLTPNQLTVFPDGWFDVFLSISTLPEMQVEQVENYLAIMARLARRGVYLKQWREHVNALDGYPFSYTSLELPAPFSMVLDRRDAVQPLFQERAWTRSGNV